MSQNRETRIRIKKDKASAVFKGLLHNLEKYDALLCPCKFHSEEQRADQQYITDNSCPCEEFQTMDFCHCDLFTTEEIVEQREEKVDAK